MGEEFLLTTPSQREGLRSLLAERDELITLLARSDSEPTDRLFNVYSTDSKLANNNSIALAHLSGFFFIVDLRASSAEISFRCAST